MSELVFGWLTLKIKTVMWESPAADPVEMARKQFESSNSTMCYCWFLLVMCQTAIPSTPGKFNRRVLSDFEASCMLLSKVEWVTRIASDGNGNNIRILNSYCYVNKRKRRGYCKFLEGKLNNGRVLKRDVSHGRSADAHQLQIFFSIAAFLPWVHCTIKWGTDCLSARKNKKERQIVSREITILRWHRRRWGQITEGVNSMNTGHWCRCTSEEKVNRAFQLKETLFFSVSLAKVHLNSFFSFLKTSFSHASLHFYHLGLPCFIGLTHKLTLDGHWIRVV